MSELADAELELAARIKAAWIGDDNGLFLQMCREHASAFPNQARKALSRARELCGAAALRIENARLREALGIAQQGMSDWICIYAGELVGEEDAQEAAKRVGEYGTIGYIANVQSVIATALGTQP